MQDKAEQASGAITVRPAYASDVHWMLPQLQKFSQFYGTKIQLFGDEAHARCFIENQIEQHLVLIADRDGTGPIGFISGIVTLHPYNPSIRLLSESFWWVDEEFRGTRAGLLLLEEFVAWGKVNCDWITFALEEHSPVRDKSLLKRGFHLQERSFLMEVP